MKFEKDVIKTGLEKKLLVKYGKKLSEGLDFEIYNAIVTGGKRFIFLLNI
jgi:hypothetical protein